MNHSHPQQQPRERVHNPNYPRQSSPTPSYSGQLPTMSQPPPQQPPFDPFQRSGQRRDPFIPSFSSKPRDSIQSTNHRHPDDHQYPPQPPQSPYRAAPSSSYPHERRSSAGGPYRPSIYDQAQPPQSQPPPYGHHMPPPASSPTRDPYPPSSNNHYSDRPRTQEDGRNGHRAPRTSASMSIHSLVDSEPSSAPPPRPAWSPLGKEPSHNGPMSRTRPSSPGPPYGFRAEHEAYPYTPPSRMHSEAAHRRETNGYQGPSPTDRQAQAGERPGNGVHGFSKLLQSFHHSPPPPTGSYPPRPFSQPVGPYPGQGGQPPYDAPRPLMEDHGAPLFGKLQRDRAASDLDGRRAPLLSEPFPRPPPERAFGRLADQPPSRSAMFEDRAPFPSQHEIPPSVSTYQQNDYPSSTSSPADTRHPPTTNQAETHIHDERRPSRFETSRPSLFEVSPQIERRTQRTPPVVDAGLRQSIEGNRAQQKSFLSGRLERSSPMPQAVQGAQSQPADSGRDPGIKQEFGRMFSGLGSGVGSTPVPMLPPHNGTGTPTRRSPLDERKAPPEALNRHGPLPNAADTATKSGRRGKRAGGEEHQQDSDGTGQRLTSAALSKVPKRNRYIDSPVPHHHHHHPAAPHHHHHIRKPEDDQGASSLRNSARPGGGTPQPGITPPIPHHHHHHHHTHTSHHHHHLPKPKKLPFPVLNIQTSPVLREVSHLPRKYLGSQLYHPISELPAPTAATIDAKRYIDVAPNPLPRFQRAQANSTFTIRVPRHHLAPEARQVIMRSRRLWGTEVYTDDSDPVAAAIHSGWIRGAFTDPIQAHSVAMELITGLDRHHALAEVRENEKPGPVRLLQLVDVGPKPDSCKTLDTPPSKEEGGSVVPPWRERDCYITLLILPPLENYAASTWNGVRSREWGGNHDGMSFKIHRIEWVDGVDIESRETGRLAVKEAIKRRLQAEVEDVRKLRRLLGSADLGVKERGSVVYGGGEGGQKAVSAAA